MKYLVNRTNGNFYTAIEKQNSIAKEPAPTKGDQVEFSSSMNSYIGIMKNYSTYKLRKKMLFKKLLGGWWNYVYISDRIGKYVLTKAKKLLLAVVLTFNFLLSTFNSTCVPARNRTWVWSLEGSYSIH